MSKRPFYPPSSGQLLPTAPTQTSQLVQEQPMANFEGGYNESRPKRIREIVEHFGEDAFRGKTLLEVGAGYGHIGAVFANEYGADVLCTEARADYVDEIRKRSPQVRADVQDLEAPWPYDNKFDFILLLGVLHHINPSYVPTLLKDICAATDALVLEHEVEDNEDSHKIVSIDRPHYDQSVHKLGCRPTPNYIERILTEEGMQFKCCMDPRLDGPAHFTWAPGQGRQFGGGARRMWIAWK